MGAQTSRVPLPDYSIPWYRTPLDPEVSAQLHKTSDVQGATQTLLFLGELTHTHHVHTFPEAEVCEHVVVPHVTVSTLGVERHMKSCHSFVSS